MKMLIAIVALAPCLALAQQTPQYLPKTGGTLSGSLTVSGKVTTPIAQADLMRNNAAWYDVRAKGLLCDGSTDDSTAFAALIGTTSSSPIGYSHVEFPPTICMVNPGTNLASPAFQIPNVGQRFRLQGRDNYTGRIQDINGVSSGTQNDAPLLQFGVQPADGTGFLANMDMDSMIFRGGNNITYPDGMLSYADSVNLFTISNSIFQWVGTNASSSDVMISNATAISDGNYDFAEMKFINDSFYGQNSAPIGTAFSIQSTSGNTNFTNSNIEAFANGINFQGYQGTPTLTFDGGHFERIGFVSVFADQATVFIRGTDMSAGAISLGPGVVGSDITAGASAPAWWSYYNDNGIGNHFHRVAAANTNNLGGDFDGKEWYRVPGNLIADPTFNISGATGWTGVGGGSASVQQLPAPGAPAGNLLVVSSSANGGYIYQTYAKTAMVDYLVGVLAHFDARTSILSNQIEIRIYDGNSSTTGNSNLVWDSGVVTPLGGTIASYSEAWRFLKMAIPGDAYTYFTVQIFVPNDAYVAEVGLLGIWPSVQTMVPPTFTGTSGLAACSTNTPPSAGSPSWLTWVGAYTCTVTGESGSNFNNLYWSVGSMPYGGFLHFHAVTASDAGSPAVSFADASGHTTSSIYMQPGTSYDYTIPLNSFPGYIAVSDSSGPSTEHSSVAISGLWAAPFGSTAIMPTTTPGDGNYVTGITPDGIQHRAAVSPPAPVAMTGVNTYTGTGSPISIFSNSTGPFSTSRGIEFVVAGARTAGTGAQTFQFTLGGTQAYACTYTQTGNYGFVFHGYILNTPSSAGSQNAVVDPMFSNNTIECVSRGGGAAALASWASAQTFAVNWTGATSADTIQINTVAVYAK